MRPLQKGSFCPQRCSQMLIYYLINCALLPSWEQKIALFARGLNLCKTIIDDSRVAIQVVKSIAAFGRAQTMLN